MHSLYDTVTVLNVKYNTFCCLLEVEVQRGCTQCICYRRITRFDVTRSIYTNAHTQGWEEGHTVACFITEYETRSIYHSHPGWVQLTAHWPPTKSRKPTLGSWLQVPVSPVALQSQWSGSSLSPAGLLRCCSWPLVSWETTEARTQHNHQNTHWQCFCDRYPQTLHFFLLQLLHFCRLKTLLVLTKEHIFAHLHVLPQTQILLHLAAVSPSCLATTIPSFSWHES